MELKELVVGAQDAMDRGDFRLAQAANTHALKAYPACLAAHRMMGEANLERGDRESAVQHFERTLQIDPLNVVARLGLGVAAEETRNFQAAYAHYLHAWEINPALDQVRDELVRLRSLLNVNDRLHPTRAGLAGIHARAGQFRRAIGEWRAVLAIEPESRRGRTSLAELLWRSGDDAGAAVAAREALRACPENARALAILADTERRRGSNTAEEIAERFAEVDPTGDLIPVLQPWRIDADLSFLKVDSAPLDDFDFDAHRSQDTGPLGGRKTVTASLTGSQVAAPDLWDTLVKDLATDIPATNVAPTMASGVEPVNWTAGGSAAPAEPAVAAQPAPTVDDLAGQIFSAPQEGEEPEQIEGLEGVVPFELPDADTFEAEIPVAVETVRAAVAARGGQDGMASDTFGDLTRAMADEEQVGADLATVGAPVNAVASAQDAGNQSDSTGSYGISASSHAVIDADSQGDAAPVAGSNGTAPPAQSISTPATNNHGGDFVDPFVTADGQIDLTRGWDDLDRALADATPSFEGNEGFDGLLADLDGIQPFDAVVGEADDDAWAPLFDDDLAAEPVASAPSADAPGSVDPDSQDEPVETWLDDATAAAEQLVMPAEEEIPAPAPLETYSSVLDAVVASEEPKDATGELLDFAALEALDASAFADEPATPAIEPEIITGIPAPQPSGYTELLRNVDEETLTTPDEPVAEVDPFAIPDGTGEPLEFDELLEVTSSDGTGPLAIDAAAEEAALAAAELANPFDFAATDLEAALPPGGAADLGLELDGIVPFDSSAFAEADALDAPVEFGEIDQPAAQLEQESVAGLSVEVEFDVEPFTPEIRPFGYTDALSALDDEPFDFSDVVVEPELVFEDAVDEAGPLAAEGDAFEAEESAEVQVAEVAEEAVESESETIASAAPARHPAWAGKEGLGNVARKVLWPQFVNQTSELIDRALETDDLFERITAQKQAMVAQGAIQTTRRVASRLVAVVPVEPDVEQAAQSEQSGPEEMSAPAPPQMSEQTRLDLMAMRIRLIEDEDAAGEIAGALEQAIAEGLQSPLALRVLGEAYLKLGQVERAAAQFRQAMLARRRAGQENR